MPPDDEFERELAELGQKYRGRLSTLAEFLSAVLLSAASGPIQPRQRADLALKAHQFAGSGSSFGFPAVSDSAAALDQYMSDHPRAELAQLSPLIRAFERAVREATEGSP
jgi:HPt (histidine-containing phosphotransfer) domain-containing protein